MPHPLIHRLLGATCKLTIKSPIMDSTECVYTIGDEDVEVDVRVFRQVVAMNNALKEAAGELSKYLKEV